MEYPQGDLLPLLSSGEVDAIVTPWGRNTLRRKPFDYLPLYRVKLVLAVSNQSPLAMKKVVSISDIVGHPLGYLSAPIPAVERVINEFIRCHKPGSKRRHPDIRNRTVAGDDRKGADIRHSSQ